ncbi:hypothetical protein ABTY20_31530 [Streptomyces sp. NPDC126497]|uniref:hypothetical protein n=1 Tax=Streptomyces sp. NPDC126497 TaxID=3155313 RepID=UPI00331A72F7
MRKTALTRRAMTSAAAFIVVSALSGPAFADESVEGPSPSDWAVGGPAIGDLSEESEADSTVASVDISTTFHPVPAMSASQLAEENKLNALPEVSDSAVNSEGAEDEIGPMACDNPMKTWYAITSKKAVHVPSWWNGTSFKDGPGGKMLVKVEKAGKISAEIGTSGEAEFDAVIAKAKVTVSAKIAAEVGITTGHTYEHVIPAKRYGHLQYGSWGYKISWTKYKTSADRCGKVKIKSGSGKTPTKETGWRWWHTAT